jgi:hypothetical protein
MFTSEWVVLFGFFTRENCNPQAHFLLLSASPDPDWNKPALLTRRRLGGGEWTRAT